MHVVGPYMAALPEGARPFYRFTPQAARDGLKMLLHLVGDAKAQAYWLHDLRRGHAEDLRSAGASPDVIRAAGDWSARSRAYLHYQDQVQQECDEVNAFVLSDESDEERIGIV